MQQPVLSISPESLCTHRWSQNQQKLPAVICRGSCSRQLFIGSGNTLLKCFFCRTPYWGGNLISTLFRYTMYAVQRPLIKLLHQADSVLMAINSAWVMQPQSCKEMPCLNTPWLLSVKAFSDNPSQALLKTRKVVLDLVVCYYFTHHGHFY